LATPGFGAFYANRYALVSRRQWFEGERMRRSTGKARVPSSRFGTWSHGSHGNLSQMGSPTWADACVFHRVRRGGNRIGSRDFPCALPSLASALQSEEGPSPKRPQRGDTGLRNDLLARAVAALFRLL